MSEEIVMSFITEILQRCEMTGGGASSLNFAADILALIGLEAESRSNTCEDALQIANVMLSASDALRREAGKPLREGPAPRVYQEAHP